MTSRWNGGSIGARATCERREANPAREAGSTDLVRASLTSGIRVGGARRPLGSTQGGVKLKRSFVALLCVLCPALGAAAPAEASSGGAYASEAAVIQKLGCVARCATIDAVQPGSLLRVRGKAMRAVRRILFLGARGRADDVTVPALRARIKSVDVVVPAAAPSGPLIAINGDGARSLASPAAVSVQRVATSGAALDMRVVGQRVYYGAARQARVDLLARQPLAVSVVLARLSDGAVVMSWPLGPLAAGVVRTISWDGTIAGAPQPVGRYEFRVFAQAGEAQAAQAPTPLATGAFDLVDHEFPIRGAHTYGTGIAAFGAAAAVTRTRARTSSRTAARRWSRPAAAS